MAAVRCLPELLQGVKAVRLTYINAYFVMEVIDAYRNYSFSWLRKNDLTDLS